MSIVNQICKLLSEVDEPLGISLGHRIFTALNQELNSELKPGDSFHGFALFMNVDSGAIIILQRELKRAEFRWAYREGVKVEYKDPFVGVS